MRRGIHLFYSILNWLEWKFIRINKYYLLHVQPQPDIQHSVPGELQSSDPPPPRPCLIWSHYRRNIRDQNLQPEQTRRVIRLNKSHHFCTHAG